LVEEERESRGGARREHPAKESEETKKGLEDKKNVG